MDDKEIMADKVINYIDKVKSELYCCITEYHQLDVRSREDALDIAVKLYYLRRITDDLIQDLKKGGE